MLLLRNSILFRKYYVEYLINLNSLFNCCSVNFSKNVIVFRYRGEGIGEYRWSNSESVYFELKWFGLDKNRFELMCFFF